MSVKNLRIIDVCNWVGKTTASFGIRKEFVNGNKIAIGLSPFKPETVSFESGGIKLQRIEGLLKNKQALLLKLP